MEMCLIIITLALIWLLYETKYLTVQLPAGAGVKPIELPKFKPWLCYHRHSGYLLPARTINAFGHIINLTSSCNWCRAELLKRVAKVQATKATARPNIHTKVDFVRSVYPLGNRWGLAYPDNQPKLVFDDCLAGKTWLRRNYRRHLPEPTMEISVNGTTLTVNGNYKKGIIRDFIKANNKIEGDYNAILD